MSYRPLNDQGTATSEGVNATSSNGNTRSFRALRDPLAPFIDWIINSLPKKSQVIGYLAGGLFAIGWWIFIDGVTIATTLGGLDACTTDSLDNCYKVPNVKLCQNESCLVASPKFEDWLPGIFSTFSLIIVNLVDKESLNGESDFGFNSNNVAIKSRAIAFIGATMGLGAIGGALTITIIKTIIAKKISQASYLGITVTVSNFLIFAGSMVLWFGRNSFDENQIRI